MKIDRKKIVINIAENIKVSEKDRQNIYRDR
jgi:hypothetical protein